MPELGVSLSRQFCRKAKVWLLGEGCNSTIVGWGSSRDFKEIIDLKIRCLWVKEKEMSFCLGSPKITAGTSIWVPVIYLGDDSKNMVKERVLASKLGNQSAVLLRTFWDCIEHTLKLSPSEKKDWGAHLPTFLAYVGGWLLGQQLLPSVIKGLLSPEEILKQREADLWSRSYH